MYSKKYFFKTIAIFMALNIFTQVVAPTVSMALTSGSTMPEVASFEPVDTTDMVDLTSGDFNYNIPLLEVPGPEGSYPLTLAYHAGIMPGQDASWVGLGWNLNAGSINRRVNNYADDLNNTSYTISDYWAGGQTTQYSYGIGLGIGGNATLGLTIGVRSDTYKGNHGSVGIGLNWLHLSTGFNYDEEYGLSNSILGMQGSGLGIPTTAALVGMGILKNTKLGTSYGADPKIGSKYSATPDRYFVGKLSNNGFQMSTEKEDFGIGIFSYSKVVTKYWIDATEESKLFGSLYSKAINQSCTGACDLTRNYDCAVLLDPAKSPIDQADLDNTNNPSVPTTDNYLVASQGLYGAMEPVILDNGSMYRKQYKAYNSSGTQIGTGLASTTSKAATVDKHNFRFIGDFSNSHVTTDVTNYTVSAGNLSYISSGLGYKVDMMAPDGYSRATDLTKIKVAGSKNVEYFTNDEIYNGTAKANGFINTRSLANASRTSFKTADNVSHTTNKQIGGYSITTSEGITYHYALPVYTFGSYEEQSVPMGQNYGRLKRTITNPQAYAYTWLLTSITGPDYVDRNNNGYLDDNDWGYWVDFDYGQYHASYGYRAPDEGTLTNTDGSLVFSKGFKQIYYLNSIKTRSHTALFVKDTRIDARGMNGYTGDGFTGNYNTTCTGEAVRTLKLSEVMLFDNNTLAGLFNTSSYWQAGAVSLNTVSANGAVNTAGTCTASYYYTDNATLETKDLARVPAAYDAFKNKALKRIQFDHSYDLCPNTRNSFDTDVNTKSGKLTLNKIRFFGRNQVQLLPSTNFKYDLDNPVQSNIQISHAPGVDAGFTGRMGRIDCGSFSNDYSVGDILKFTTNGKTFYVTLVKGIDYYSITNALYDVCFLGKELPVAGDKWVASLASQTKNPPYTPEFYDNWEMFKSDYNPVSNTSSNRNRTTTAVSGKAVDCWSLRSIETPMGSIINIEHESDDYRKNVLKNTSIINVNRQIQVCYKNTTTYTNYGNPVYSIKNASLDPIKYYKLFIDNSQLYRPLNEIFIVGQSVPATSLGGYYSQYSTVVYKVKSGVIKIEEVGADYLIVSDDGHAVFCDDQISIGGVPTTAFVHVNSFIKIPTNSYNKGGGLRTKSISVSDPMTGTVSNVTYNYSFDNASSGVVPYDYTGMDELWPVTNLPFPPPPRTGCSSPCYTVEEGAVKEYQNRYLQTHTKTINASAEVISPFVMYENVGVKHYIIKNGVTTEAPTNTIYTFRSYTEDMYSFVDLLNTSNGNAQARTVKIINKTAHIGELLSVKTLDKTGRVLGSVANTYQDELPTKQGMFERVYNERRDVLRESGTKKYGIVAIQSDYPSILVSSTEKNYSKGTVSKTDYTAFDFYSGDITEFRTQDTYGNTNISVVEPAYIYYAGLGLKMANIQNNNMLASTAAVYQFVKKATNNVYTATVTSTANTVAPKEILVTLSGTNTVPINYHNGSAVAGFYTPVYITYIAADRKSFKGISNAPVLSTDLGTKTLTFENADIVSASIFTWSDSWNYRQSAGSSYQTLLQTEDAITSPYHKEKVWREKSAYIWSSPYLNTDGTYPTTGSGAFVPFRFDNASQTSPYWITKNTNSLFTPYSKNLEQIDINGKYTSVKYADNEKYFMASAVNARYTEFTHSGAEFDEILAIGYAEGEVYGSSYRTTEKTHTGTYSFKTPVAGVVKYSTPYSSSGNVFYQASTPYRISVWIEKANVANAQLYCTVTNGTASTTTQNYDAAKHVAYGNWVLMTMDVTTPATSTNIEVAVKNAGASGFIYADDFRFQPSVSAVTANVYDLNTGMLTHVLDEDNHYIRYEYDNKYNIKAIYKETTAGEVKVNEYNYNFARPIN